MIVVGMLRVKNEARWIKRCLESISPICTGGIAVFDDHSTDGTPDIAMAVDGVAVIHSPFEGTNEARDKNYMLTALNPRADWVIAIDGDEELRSFSDLRKLQSAMRESKAKALSLPIWYLWDREDQRRVDGVYGNFHRESVFRPRPGAKFHQLGEGPNFHCGNVPPALREHREIVDAPLLHYGYLDRSDRLRKYSWYNAKDPDNHAEDRYRHMVQGDLAEMPAETILKHAGPLTLRPLLGTRAFDRL